MDAQEQRLEVERAVPGDHDLSVDYRTVRERGTRRLADNQHRRTDEAGSLTGYVWPDDVNWPAEHTTYTAAAVILAADALAGATPGSDIMRGATLPAQFSEIALECDCLIAQPTR